MTVSYFRNVYLSVRSLQILWSPNEGLKKSFLAVLDKSDSHNHRSRETAERNWRRPFTYFAVLGVVHATENEQKSPKGNSHICTPSKQDNPPYRFNVRSSNGRFAKSKEKDVRAEHPGGGGDFHMKQTGMLVVSLRGVNFGFWSRLGCSGQSANILCRQGLV